MGSKLKQKPIKPTAKAYAQVAQANRDLLDGKLGTYPTGSAVLKKAFPEITGVKIAKNLESLRRNNPNKTRVDVDTHLPTTLFTNVPIVGGKNQIALWLDERENGILIPLSGDPINVILAEYLNSFSPAEATILKQHLQKDPAGTPQKLMGMLHEALLNPDPMLTVLPRLSRDSEKNKIRQKNLIDGFSEIGKAIAEDKEIPEKPSQADIAIRLKRLIRKCAIEKKKEEIEIKNKKPIFVDRASQLKRKFDPNPPGNNPIDRHLIDFLWEQDSDTLLQLGGYEVNVLDIFTRKHSKNINTISNQLNIAIQNNVRTPAEQAEKQIEDSYKKLVGGLDELQKLAETKPGEPGFDAIEKKEADRLIRKVQECVLESKQITGKTDIQLGQNAADLHDAFKKAKEGIQKLAIQSARRAKSTEDTKDAKRVPSDLERMAVSTAVAAAREAKVSEKHIPFIAAGVAAGVEKAVRKQAKEEKEKGIPIPPKVDEVFYHAALAATIAGSEQTQSAPPGREDEYARFITQAVFKGLVDEAAGDPSKITGEAGLALARSFASYKATDLESLPEEKPHPYQHTILDGPSDDEIATYKEKIKANYLDKLEKLEEEYLASAHEANQQARNIRAVQQQRDGVSLELTLQGKKVNPEDVPNQLLVDEDGNIIKSTQDDEGNFSFSSNFQIGFTAACKEYNQNLADRIIGHAVRLREENKPDKPLKIWGDSVNIIEHLVNAALKYDHEIDKSTVDALLKFAGKNKSKINQVTALIAKIDAHNKRVTSLNKPAEVQPAKLTPNVPKPQEDLLKKLVRKSRRLNREVQATQKKFKESKSFGVRPQQEKINFRNELRAEIEAQQAKLTEIQSQINHISVKKGRPGFDKLQENLKSITEGMEKNQKILNSFEISIFETAAKNVRNAISESDSVKKTLSEQIENALTNPPPPDKKSPDRKSSDKKDDKFENLSFIAQQAAIARAAADLTSQIYEVQKQIVSFRQLSNQVTPPFSDPNVQAAYNEFNTNLALLTSSQETNQQNRDHFSVLIDLREASYYSTIFMTEHEQAHNKAKNALTVAMKLSLDEQEQKTQLDTINKELESHKIHETKANDSSVRANKAILLGENNIATFNYPEKTNDNKILDDAKARMTSGKKFDDERMKMLKKVEWLKTTASVARESQTLLKKSSLDNPAFTFSPEFKSSDDNLDTRRAKILAMVKEKKEAAQKEIKDINTELDTLSANNKDILVNALSVDAKSDRFTPEANAFIRLAKQDLTDVSQNIKIAELATTKIELDGLVLETATILSQLKADAETADKIATQQLNRLQGKPVADDASLDAKIGDPKKLYEDGQKALKELKAALENFKAPSAGEGDTSKITQAHQTMKEDLQKKITTLQNNLDDALTLMDKTKATNKEISNLEKLNAAIVDAKEITDMSKQALTQLAEAKKITSVLRDSLPKDEIDKFTQKAKDLQKKSTDLLTDHTKKFADLDFKQANQHTTILEQEKANYTHNHSEIDKELEIIAKQRRDQVIAIGELNGALRQSNNALLNANGINDEITKLKDEITKLTPDQKSGQVISEDNLNRIKQLKIEIEHFREEANKNLEAMNTHLKRAEEICKDAKIDPSKVFETNRNKCIDSSGDVHIALAEFDEKLKEVNKLLSANDDLVAQKAREKEQQAQKEAKAKAEKELELKAQQEKEKADREKLERAQAERAREEAEKEAKAPKEKETKEHEKAKDAHSDKEPKKGDGQDQHPPKEFAGDSKESGKLTASFEDEPGTPLTDEKRRELISEFSATVKENISAAEQLIADVKNSSDKTPLTDGANAKIQQANEKLSQATLDISQIRQLSNDLESSHISSPTSEENVLLNGLVEDLEKAKKDIWKFDFNPANIHSPKSAEVFYTPKSGTETPPTQSPTGNGDKGDAKAKAEAESAPLASPKSPNGNGRNPTIYNSPSLPLSAAGYNSPSPPLSAAGKNAVNQPKELGVETTESSTASSYPKSRAKLATDPSRVSEDPDQPGSPRNSNVSTTTSKIIAADPSNTNTSPSPRGK